MPPVIQVRSHDTEEFSRSLKQANVSAIQISKGAFQGELHQYAIGNWSLQHLNFMEGRSSCAGEAPPDRHAFVVPLRYPAGCRLLGKPLTNTTMGIYSPRGEHADVTDKGLEEVVLIPPKRLLVHPADWQNEIEIPRTGSRHWHAPLDAVETVRTLLREIHQLARSSPSSLIEPEVVRSLDDALSSKLTATLNRSGDRTAAGRPPLPRPVIMRQVAEILMAHTGEPIYAGELCAATGISHPTLQRIFIEWFGIPPARYLTLKRLYLARRRLGSRQYETVGEVAASCGFWELSRFSRRYKNLFGVAPSQTLRKRPA